MSELYQLPDGWEWKTIDEFTTIKSGKRVPKSKKLLDDVTPYPYIRVTDFSDNGTVDTSDIKYISEDIYQQIKNYTITDEDIYISVAGTIGKTGIIPSELNGANLTENAVKIVFDNSKYDKNFIFNFTNSITFMEQIGLATKTVAMPKLAIKRLKEVFIPLPPLEEQKRIVSKLDTLFEKIDKAISLHQKNIDEANVFMASVLNDIFVELEEKYEKKQLKDIVDNYDGKRIPIKSSDRESINGIYPYYGASGIIDYVNDYIFDGEYLLISEDGANLTVRKYPIAFIATGKFWVNNHAHIVSAKENISSNKFMEYAFAFTDISDYITGSAQPKMSQGKMNLIEFVIPPLQTQQKIVAYLDEISQKLEKIKQLQKEKMAHLKALKASILDSAFRGEL
jgi:type I restriction enzyme S subunit